MLSFLPVFASEALTAEESAKLLPDNLGEFRARGTAQTSALTLGETGTPEDFTAYSAATRTYASPQGGTFILTLVRTRSEGGAYALLTKYAAELRGKGQVQLLKSAGVGTIAFATPEQIIFFKGAAFVSITKKGAPSTDEQLINFARALSDTLTSEENDVPALAKHLPDWETAQERARFAVTHRALQESVGNQPVLDAFDFTGGTEAVTATYGDARLVIVEFGTPQFSIENDARIKARLKELRDAGQPVPTAYRREGNYSVFVFNAADEGAAAQLMNSIRYEKVVQWLGDNPRAWDRLEKEYTETTVGIIVSVVQAAALGALLCLVVGSIFGGLVFMRRRAQQAMTDKYSDAGGLLRLNIDELTPQIDPSRLLEKGDR